MYQGCYSRVPNILLWKFFQLLKSVHIPLQKNGEERVSQFKYLSMTPSYSNNLKIFWNNLFLCRECNFLLIGAWSFVLRTLLPIQLQLLWLHHMYLPGHLYSYCKTTCISLKTVMFISHLHGAFLLLFSLQPKLCFVKYSCFSSLEDSGGEKDVF